MARVIVRGWILAFTLLLAGASPALARAGRLGGGGDLNISLTRIVTALLLCTMIAVLAALLIRRSGGRFDLVALRRLVATLPVERRIDVVESRRVSQHADLCLVRCGDREYLILSSARQQQVLRDVEWAGQAVPEGTE